MRKFFFLVLIFCVFFSGCETKPNNYNIDPIYVNNIVINQSHAYVNVNEKVVLLAQVYPFNADNQTIKWRSDNTSVAKVDDGVVFGVGEGRTVITAISEDGNFEAKCIVYVSYPKLDYYNTPNNLF